MLPVDEAHLPAILTSQPMTAEEFAELCSDHPRPAFRAGN
jgi:hypothetical protein